MNSCTHGLTAQQVVIGDEDPAQFGILVAGLEAEYEPQSMLEVELVGRLAGALWRLRRIPRFEAALIEARCAELGPYTDHDIGRALIQDSRHQDTLGKLSRYEAALLNVSTRTLQQLLFLQDRRARDDSGVVEVLALPVNGPDAASQ